MRSNFVSRHLIDTGIYGEIFDEDISTHQGLFSWITSPKNRRLTGGSLSEESLALRDSNHFRTNESIPSALRYEYMAKNGSGAVRCCALSTRLVPTSRRRGGRTVKAVCVPTVKKEQLFRGSLFRVLSPSSTGSKYRNSRCYREMTEKPSSLTHISSSQYRFHIY